MRSRSADNSVYIASGIVRSVMIEYLYKVKPIIITTVIRLFNTLLLAYQLLIITLIRLACLTGAVVV